MSSRSQSPRGASIVFGIFATLGLAVVSLFWCCYFVGGGALIAIRFFGGEYASGFEYLGLGLIGLGVLFVTPNVIMCLTALLGTILAIVGYTRWKVVCVFNIIFGILSFIPFVLLLPWGIYFTLGIILLILMALTPVGWIGFAFLFAFYGSLIFAITSISAGAKGLSR